jgi:hypothetical protein
VLAAHEVSESFGESESIFRCEFALRSPDCSYQGVTAVTIRLVLLVEA